MILGLGLFAAAMVVAVALGAIAAKNSREFNEAEHVSLVGNGNGHRRTSGRKA